MELRTETHDWFSSAFKEQTSKSYRYEEFVAQLEKQILKKIDCLHADYYCFNQQYFMKDLKIVLERPKFEELCPRVNDKTESLYPILTFHSTQNVTKVNSIVKYGYILPNDVHPTFGWTLLMRTGNIYGDGVYSSPDFNTAEWYTFVDQKSAVQVIVNMVFIGASKTVEAGKWFKDKKQKDLKGVIPSLCGCEYVDAEGTYQTLLSPSAKIYVTGDSRRIIPVAVLTLSPNAGEGAMKSYLSLPTKPLMPLNSRGPRVTGTEVTKVDLFHVHKDYYVLDLRSAICTTTSTADDATAAAAGKVVHMFSIPKRQQLLNDPVFSKGLNDFINSLTPATTTATTASVAVTRSVFLYSNTTEKFDMPTGSSDAFQSLCASPTLRYLPASLYVENIGPHLAALLEDILRVNSNEPANITFVLYLFVSNPTDLEAVEKVCAEYRVFKRLLVKLIFLPMTALGGIAGMTSSEKDQTKQKKERDKVMRQLGEVKAAFHNVHIFEQFQHCLDDKLDNLNEVLDTLTDEASTLSKSLNVSTLVQIPYPCGVIGEGFVNALESQPVWDADTTLPFVLYRGGSSLTSGVLINRRLYSVHYCEKTDKVWNELKKKEKECEDVNRQLLQRLNSMLKHQGITIEDQTYQDDETLMQSRALAGELPTGGDDTVNANKFAIVSADEISAAAAQEISVSDKEALNAQRFQHRLAEVKTSIAANLKTHQSCVSDLSDYDDTHKLQACLLPLLARFRLHVFSNPERCKSHCEHIVEFLELLVERLSRVSDGDNGSSSCSSSSGMSNDYLTVSVRKSIKHQLQKLLTDIEAFGSVTFTGRWLKQLMRIRFAKRLIKRTRSTDNAYTDIDTVKALIVNGWSRLYGRKIYEVLDLFPYFSHKKGILIRLQLTQAAVIEPWNCIVEYVSIDQAVLSEVFAQCESGALIRDSKGFRVTDLLLLNHSTDSTHPYQLDAIDKLYFSYVFTASPYLYLPSQSLALLVNTWVSSIEKVFKIMIRKTVRGKQYDSDKVRHMLEISYELFLRVRDRVLHTSELTTLCADVTRSDDISTVSVDHYLTTKNNVVSINKVLAALTALPAVRSDNTASVIPGRLHFALLSEAAARSCIVKVRSTRTDSDHYIMEVLGMSYQMDVTTYQFDKAHSDRALKITNAFFLKQWTNCSAFSVVGVLGFIEHLLSHFYTVASAGLEVNQSGAVDCLLQAFTSESISMKNFLLKHMPEGTSGRVTQLALYLHGMKQASVGHNTSSSSSSGVGSGGYHDPVAIKKNTIAEYLTKIRERQESLRQLGLRRNAKNQQKLEAVLERAAVFRDHHGTPPRLFTPQEVDALNISRPKDDQLELLQPSMLLKYHCCYPNCPQYLHRFMTKRDVKTSKQASGSTRFGLMHHFQYDGVLNNYVKGFHSIGRVIAGRSSSYDEFVGKMGRHFKDSREYKSLVDLEKNLTIVWNAAKNS